MTEQERADVLKARAAYYRNWRKAHPENVRKAQERYWMKKIEKNIEQIETAQAIAPEILETRWGYCMFDE